MVSRSHRWIFLFSNSGEDRSHIEGTIPFFRIVSYDWIFVINSTLQQMQCLLGWTISLTVIIISIFGKYPFCQFDSKSTPFVYGLFLGLSRVAWAIALCYIIFACVHNYGGPINWFLSHPLWQPLSRLSFATYLLQFPVLIFTFGSMKTSPHLSQLFLVSLHRFWFNFVYIHRNCSPSSVDVSKYMCWLSLFRWLSHWR